MKQRLFIRVFVSVLCSALVLASPLSVVADGAEPLPPDAPVGLSPVIITEVQTGSQTASDEFVEIYNTTDDEIDITGWQVRYANSTVIDGTSFVLATISAPDNSPVLLPAKSYYLLRTASIVVPVDILAQVFPAGLSKTDKTVGLFRKDDPTCQMIIVDAVAWEATAGTTKGEGAAVVVPTDTVGKDKLLRRYGDPQGAYWDTDDNSTDFVLAPDFTAATPGADNGLVLPSEPVGTAGAPSELLPVNITGCTVPEPETPPEDESSTDSPPSTTIPPADEEGPEDEDDEGATPVIPAGNIGLRPPQISELLPNPAPPQTDANDEFVELYNPNDAPFDLSAYVLEAGLATKRRYTFTAGTLIPPRSFLAFFSADTKLALSNSGSQVSLIDPLGALLVASEPYGTAKDGQAWLLANGSWQWTTSPTPNALNAVSAPVVKTASTSKTSSKKSTKKPTATTKTPKPKKEAAMQDVQQATSVAATASTPLHPGVLALIAASALLYGAYEYRHDMANKIYQLRSNRAARRALRKSTKGR